MFDVLVYLYENYWRPDACPEHEQLTRKLSSVGFESEEIEDALTWLDGDNDPDRFVRLYEDEEAQAAGIERYRGSEG